MIRILVRRLIGLIDGVDPGEQNKSAEPLHDIEVAWEEEISKRMGAIDLGVAKGKAWEEVLKSMDRRL